jgi:hypothetical protein
MKNIPTYQEILIFTNTKFSARDWSSKEETKGKELNHREQLKNACWNGLITELLPEICEKTYDPTLTLWEINEAENFLELQFGTNQDRTPIAYSINPYLSLIGKEYN